MCSVVSVAPCSLGVGGPTDIVLIVSFIVRDSLKLVYFVDLIGCQAMILDRSQDVPVAFIRQKVNQEQSTEFFFKYFNDGDCLWNMCRPTIEKCFTKY